MTIEPNTIISHYKILSAIGKGGMGEVYLAQDTKLNRKVAIKFLSDEFSRDSDKLNRFVREAQSASALSHPNIVTIHEIGESDGNRYIALEYIEGETLNSFLMKQHKFGSTLDIATQIASALDAAHSAGIVHRDIKPDNIMIRTDGLVKILDFGIAKLTAVSSPEIESEDKTAVQVNTTPGMIIGTANYMSPEQAAGKEVDARTDVFSFGVVLYEMLSGRLPFEGGTAMESISSILKDEPKPLNDAEVPSDLRKMIGKCLRKDPNERYQTMKGLLADLKGTKQELEFHEKLDRTIAPESEQSETQVRQATTASDAEPTAASEKTNNSITIKRSSIGKVLAGVAAIVILTAIGTGYWYFSGGNQINSIAVMPFVNESGSADAEYLSDGMTETLISSLTEIPNLSVKASSTVFYYKGKNKTPREIGTELGVEAVLLGKIRQRNEELTLRLELVDTKTLDAIWSETYNRKTSDLVSLQNEVARNVSDKLRLKLTADQKQQVAKSGTANSEAQQLYLKGRFHWNKRNVEDLEKSIEYFKQAIEKDPGYALAYVGLADSYSILPGYGTFRPKEYGAKAKQAVQKALELDKELAEAHASLANVLKNEYDWAGAEREYQKAIELNPNYASAHQWYGGMLSQKGKFEDGLKEVSKALELDPLSRVINRNKGYYLFGADRYDEAIAQLKKTVELFPDDILVYDNLASVYAAQERYAEAVEQLLMQYKLEGMPPENVASYKAIYEEKGWKGFCRKALEDHLKYREEVLAKDKNVYLSDATLGFYYAKLGEKENALEFLTKGFEERDDLLNYLKIDYEYDFLRDDPRFRELLRKIGLGE